MVSNVVSSPILLATYPDALDTARAVIPTVFLTARLTPPPLDDEVPLDVLPLLEEDDELLSFFLSPPVTIVGALGPLLGLESDDFEDEVDDEESFF